MVLIISNNKRNNENFKDNRKVDQQYNVSKISFTYSQDSNNVLSHIIGVSNTEVKGRDKHSQGDLDQSINNNTGEKMDCNNKDLKIVNHYLDPDGSDFRREFWNLIESGVGDNMIIWLYKSDINTNPNTIPTLESVGTGESINHNLNQNSRTESDEEINKHKHDEEQIETGI